MTSIGGNPHAALLAMQSVSPKLANGEKVQAQVIGPSRHGIAVQIMHENFQLDVPSRFANAKTLTLQATGLSSVVGVQVSIVEKDNRPLSETVLANLNAKPVRSPPAASAIVQTNEIKVLAQPVTADGKVQGASVTLFLQASSNSQALPFGKTSEAVVVEPSPAVEGASTGKPGSLQRTLPIIDRQAEFFKSTSNQAVANSSYNRKASGDELMSAPSRGEASLPNRIATAALQALPSHAMTPGAPVSKTTEASAPASFRSNSDTPASLPVQDGRGDVFAQRESAARPLRGEGGLPSLAKSTAARAVSTYQGASGSGFGQATEAESMSRTFPSTDPHVLTKRLQLTTAIVIGRTDAGKVILETGGQILRIEQPIDLPLGTTLQATFASGMSAPPMQPNPVLGEELVKPIIRLIELLNEIDQVGRQAAEADQPRPPGQLPAPDKYLASRFLSLLASEGKALIKEDRPSSVDGKGSTSGQRDQIQTLMRELGSVASESLVEGWRSQTLPLGSDQGQAVSLYFRDQTFDHGEESSEEEASYTDTQRALFDVSFSKLGRCQIDALCQERRFDLLIRSEKSLPPGDQQHITTLFLSAAEISGVHGEITFKIGNFFEPERTAAITQDLRT